MSDCREILIVRASERYVFRYPSGAELELIDAIVALAADPRVEFDWFDAALCSYRVGRHLGSGPSMPAHFAEEGLLPNP